jgi:hypothetical protein
MIHTFKVKPMKSRLFPPVFPVDMLRYDACWPATTEAAVDIAVSLNTGDFSDIEGNTVIELKADWPKHWHPTYERWRSFGWVVVKGA